MADDDQSFLSAKSFDNNNNGDVNDAAGMTMYSTPPPPPPPLPRRTSSKPSPYQNRNINTNFNNNNDNNYLRNSSSSLKKFMDQLTINTNITKYGIDIPMIAVMGDCSSGKSSLLSNLSMIELPSSHELTTRCPILLQLCKKESSDNHVKKQAVVTIQWKNHNSNNTGNFLNDEKKIAEEFEGEEGGEHQKYFKDRIINEDEWDTLTKVILEAQEYVLHKTGKEVAQDIVSVKICSTSLEHDLTLLDLPGIVSTYSDVNNDSSSNSNASKKESKELINDIDSLVNEYLTNPKCIILAVVPANVDFHNSQIMAMAKRVDPSTSRTIPIITKPDLIDAGAENDVLDLLLGKKVFFKLGFHMCKGRGQRSLDNNDSICKGIQDEYDFFRTTEPWLGYCNDETSTESSLFGISNLRKKLSTIQLNMIKQTIPHIINEITNKRQYAIDQLSSLAGNGNTSDGRPLTSIIDKRRYYQDFCQLFMLNLKSSLSGKGLQNSSNNRRRQQQRLSKSSFSPNRGTSKILEASPQSPSTSSAAAQLHDACTKFMSHVREGSLATIGNIVEGSQVLVTTTKGDVAGDVVHVDYNGGNSRDGSPNRSCSNHNEKSPTDTDSTLDGCSNYGYACVDCIDQKDHTLDALFDYIGYQSDDPLEVDDVWSDGDKVYIARNNNTFDVLKKIPLNKIRTDPSWLKDRIAANRTDDLACFLNIDIFKNIVSDFIDEDWEPHCYSLVDQTSHIILSAALESINQTSESGTTKTVPPRYPKLINMIRNQSERAANELIKEARKQVKAHLRIEKHPYTQDNVLFEHIVSARHRCIRRDLGVALRLDQPGAFDTAAIKTIMDGVFERSRQKSVEDHMANDMEIVLESYGKVATKRVIDRTPMICWEVFRSLCDSIQDTLWNVTDETLDVTMEDTPEYRRQYKELTEELEEMNKAMTIYQSLI